MVILGITIAFQLENWRSDSEQKSRERFYIQSLLTDVNADIIEMNEILGAVKHDMRSVDEYISSMEQAPADSLMPALIDILSLETFRGHQNTYQTLVAGSDFNALSNEQLVEAMTEYYTFYTGVRRFESVYTTLLLRLNDHFAKFVIYDQQKVVDPRVIKMPETRNFLILSVSQLQDGVENYSEGLRNAQHLKKALEASL